MCGDENPVMPKRQPVRNPVFMKAMRYYFLQEESLEIKNNQSIQPYTAILTHVYRFEN